MKKFIYNAFFLILIVIIADYVVGEVYSILVKKQKDGRYYKINYTLNQCKDDILILGSSRAETNYNSNRIGKNLGMTCWNGGRGGQGLIYFLAVEKEVLKRYLPKLIVLNIDYDFLDEPMDYDAATILRPFAREHPAIYDILQNKDKTEKYKLYSNMYIYNSTLYYLIRPYFFQNLDGKNSDRGWKPRNGTIPPSVIDIGYKNQKATNINKTSTEKIELLNSFIHLAQSKNIQLVFVISPDFLPIVNSGKSFEIVKNLAQRNNISLLNFYNDTLFIKKQNLFYDLYHMNENGAISFSEALANKLNTLTKPDMGHLNLPSKLQ